MIMQCYGIAIILFILSNISNSDSDKLPTSTEEVIVTILHGGSFGATRAILALRDLCFSRVSLTDRSKDLDRRSDMSDDVHRYINEHEEGYSATPGLTYLLCRDEHRLSGRWIVIGLRCRASRVRYLMMIALGILQPSDLWNENIMIMWEKQSYVT